MEKNAIQTAKSRLLGYMSKNHITQNEIAAVAGVDQSRVSKCLKGETSDFFTFEQMYKICDHYGLSLDSMSGLENDAGANITARRAGEMILDLLNNKFIVLEKCEVKGNAISKEAIAAYFPEWKISPSINEPFAKDKTGHDVRPENDSINRFLESMAPIFALYRDGRFPESAYKTACAALLADLPDC